MNKTDFTILIRGLKCVLIALLTAAMFGLSGWCFVETAKAPGYWAVFLFFAAIVTLGTALVLLYAQGIIRGKYIESKGEKE